MCLYNLPKVFEYSVLLERLFEVGINGNCWCLLRNWYEEVTCEARVDNRMFSEQLAIQRGVKQVSVLAPALLVIVMDPLLKMLNSLALVFPSTTSMQ